MGKHATIGNSQVGHKNTTLKQASKASMMARVYSAPLMAGPVEITSFDPLPALILEHATPFKGINPVYGQDWSQVGTTSYKLRVKDHEGRDCYVGLRRITIKPKNAKSYGLWVASYAGMQMPLVSNKNQALGLADAKDKLMALLILDRGVKTPKRIKPADKRDPAVKAYTGGAIEFAVCQLTMEPKRVCDHCHS